MTRNGDPPPWLTSSAARPAPTGSPTLRTIRTIAIVRVRSAPWAIAPTSDCTVGGVATSATARPTAATTKPTGPSTTASAANQAPRHTMRATRVLRAPIRSATAPIGTAHSRPATAAIDRPVPTWPFESPMIVV